MSFIRTKKIANKEYAYLVENKWYKRRFKNKNKGPRQKVSMYLGRVYFFNKSNNTCFFNFKRINNTKALPQEKVSINATSVFSRKTSDAEGDVPYGREPQTTITAKKRVDANPNEVSLGTGTNIEQYLKNNKNKIVKDLIEWEIFRQNIDKNLFTVDLENKKIMKGKKEVSLKINEGFLNSFTLKRLFNLNSGDSYYLAKCFVEAGIEVPQEVFVGMFGKG